MNRANVLSHVSIMHVSNTLRNDPSNIVAALKVMRRHSRRRVTDDAVRSRLWAMVKHLVQVYDGLANLKRLDSLSQRVAAEDAVPLDVDLLGDLSSSFDMRLQRAQSGDGQQAFVAASPVDLDDSSSDSHQRLIFKDLEALTRLGRHCDAFKSSSYSTSQDIKILREWVDTFQEICATAVLPTRLVHREPDFGVEDLLWECLHQAEPRFFDFMTFDDEFLTLPSWISSRNTFEFDEASVENARRWVGLQTDSLFHLPRCAIKRSHHWVTQFGS
jgi:hypothetical protein